MDKEERLRRQREFLIKFAYWAVWVCIALFLIKLVGPVLLPFVAAFLIAWLLSVPVRFASERMHIKRSLAAVVIVFLFYGLVAVLLYFLGNRVVLLIQGIGGELTEFLSNTIFPMVQNFCGWLSSLTGDGAIFSDAAGNAAVRAAGQESAQAISHAGQMVSGVSGTVIDAVSGVAAGIPGVCMNVLLAVIATVFMELDFPGILQFLRKQVPKKWQNTVFGIKDYVMGTMGKCVLSYVLIFIMTFAELSVGFLVLQIDGAFAIAFIVSILDILPVLGTGTVLIPWAVIAFAGGNFKMGIGVMGLYLIITVVRNIVEPKLVGEQMGLSPVVMLPCMILGLNFFGIVGLFGVPLAVAFLKDLNDRGVIHIFKC